MAIQHTEGTVVSQRPMTVTEQAFKSLSGAPDIYKVMVDGDVGRCEHCNHVLGNIKNRLLHTGEIIMYHRNRFRCRSCNAFVMWEPKSF